MTSQASATVAGTPAAGAFASVALGAPGSKRPDLFVAVFVAWAATVAWFHPRMWSLTDLADGPAMWWSIAYFVLFAELAWLYGLYNVAVVSFAAIDLLHRAPIAPPAPTGAQPAVAVLYTTCNDFVEESALSCVRLAYSNFRVYILDDSSRPEARAQIDAFAARHAGRVTVVRRPKRRGFKAGNLNHALLHVAHEPFFAVVDADELLPPDFLSAMLPRLIASPDCGFVQANHRSRPDPESRLARDLGLGIDIHWKWYQPLRNRYGFVMFLGHGAVLRRSCWEEVGGFPEIVSEDLAFAIAIRERGYYGVFAEDVVCFEEFPRDVRAFRIRHVKWTRGTCEFLFKWAGRLIGARRITVAEKLDILFPTLNLPMTFFFFLFMVNAAFVLPLALGRLHDVTLVFAGHEFVAPALTLRPGVERIFGPDFYAITLLTIVAPVLCFILELARRPLRLAQFLAHSTALYAALSPLTFLAVLGYATTGRAQFLVTGAASARGARGGLVGALAETHPDSRTVRGFEVMAGVLFFLAALATVQVSLVGVALGFFLLPALHRAGWDHPAFRLIVWAPFAFVLLGVALGGVGVAGLQPVFFGFGFHF